MNLRKRWLPALTLALVLVFPVVALALEIPEIISTDWLEQNLANANLRIIDIRKADDYKAGHVPNAVHQPYGTWAVTSEAKLDNQVPDDEVLNGILEAVGIGKDTAVVVVGKVDNVAEQVNQTRVAWTLKYAGVDQVGVLDGGYNKWLADKKPESVEPVKAPAQNGKPAFRKQILYSKAEVLSKIGKATIIDTRTPDFFFGASKLPFVARAGRIPGSVNLPSAWIFTKEGTFKPGADLDAMAQGVVGKDKVSVKGKSRSREVILYCDTGRLASGWWFYLSEVLGYKNVKMYDGSSQEWAGDPKAPMVKYSWQ